MHFGLVVALLTEIAEKQYFLIGCCINRIASLLGTSDIVLFSEPLEHISH